MRVNSVILKSKSTSRAITQSPMWVLYCSMPLCQYKEFLSLFFATGTWLTKWGRDCWLTYLGRKVCRRGLGESNKGQWELLRKNHVFHPLLDEWALKERVQGESGWALSFSFMLSGTYETSGGAVLSLASIWSGSQCFLAEKLREGHWTWVSYFCLPWQEPIRARSSFSDWWKSHIIFSWQVKCGSSLTCAPYCGKHSL